MCVFSYPQCASTVATWTLTAKRSIITACRRDHCRQLITSPAVTNYNSVVVAAAVSARVLCVFSPHSTSMACPHAAAVAALVWRTKPVCTNAQFAVCWRRLPRTWGLLGLTIVTDGDLSRPRPQLTGWQLLDAHALRPGCTTLLVEVAGQCLRKQRE